MGVVCGAWFSSTTRLIFIVVLVFISIGLSKNLREMAPA